MDRFIDLQKDGRLLESDSLVQMGASALFISMCASGEFDQESESAGMFVKTIINDGEVLRNYAGNLSKLMTNLYHVPSGNREGAVRQRGNGSWKRIYHGRSGES